jgi:hypothetical protein
MIFRNFFRGKFQFSLTFYRGKCTKNRPQVSILRSFISAGTFSDKLAFNYGWKHTIRKL